MTECSVLVKQRSQSLSLAVLITVGRLTEYVSEIGYNASFLVQKPVPQSSAVKSQSSAVAAAFNLDEEEEPEEMPPEARMRMRNIGRYEWIPEECCLEFWITTGFFDLSHWNGYITTWIPKFWWNDVLIALTEPKVHHCHWNKLTFWPCHKSKARLSLCLPWRRTQKLRYRCIWS